MAARKLTRKDLAEAAEIQELGSVGTRGRDRHAQSHVARRHRRGRPARAQGEGHFARAQFRPARSPGREKQVSVAGPRQSRAHHAAHRNRCLLGCARPSRHPRCRRHGGDAAAVWHPMGRARPCLLRELHVERIRLPRSDLRRRPEVRDREDQGEDGRPRCFPRRAARARQRSPRGWLRHHLRRSRPHGRKAGRGSQARRLRRRSHGTDGSQARGRQLGWLSRRRRAGVCVRDAGLDQAHAAGRASERHLGAAKCAQTRRSPASISPGTGSPSRSWA